MGLGLGLGLGSLGLLLEWRPLLGEQALDVHAAVVRAVVSLAQRERRAQLVLHAAHLLRRRLGA